MTRLRLLLSILALVFVTACDREPINGCVLAAANEREVLRAQHYLNPKIPARIIGVHFAGAGIDHAALIYRLDAGWWAYDDTFGSRSIGDKSATLPEPLAAARSAFPEQSVESARWVD